MFNSKIMQTVARSFIIAIFLSPIISIHLAQAQVNTSPVLFPLNGDSKIIENTHLPIINRLDEVPRFEEKKCQEVFPDFEWEQKVLGIWNKIDSKRFRCGYLTTWANYNSPSTEIIHLNIMVTLKKNSSTNLEPIIYLDGGPGGIGIRHNPNEAIYFTNYFERDFIQFGQRGSYFSEPHLECKELKRAIVENWEKPFGWEEWNNKQAEALNNCLEKFKKNQTSTSVDNFNSEFSAMDVMNIIRSLGYKKANLYGISYGTLLAQHVISLYPTYVNSAVLDGVVPMALDFNAHFPTTLQRSVDEIFKACENNSDCKKNYPDIEPFFYQLINQLNNQPVRILIKDKDSEATYNNVYLDGYGFLLAISSLLYRTEYIKEIPRIIYAAGNGNFKEIGEKYYITEQDQYFSWGMYYSVYCTEFSKFNPENIDFRNISPELKILNTASQQLTNKICQSYDPNNKSYGNVQIPNNNLPVLVFNGQFDPVTPPEYGDQVAKVLSISPEFIFTSPTNAHGSSFGKTGGNYDKCAKNIMKDFFNNPDQQPVSASCWQEQPKEVKFNVLNKEIYIHQLSLWWQEQKNKLMDELDRLWEDAQRQLTKWIEQKIKNWLNQPCGSAFLPAGAMAGIWISRRIKKINIRNI